MCIEAILHFAHADLQMDVKKRGLHLLNICVKDSIVLLQFISITAYLLFAAPLFCEFFFVLGFGFEVGEVVEDLYYRELPSFVKGEALKFCHFAG